MQCVHTRAFLISQIHFFFILPLEVFSKKIIKNIPYGKRVQLDRLVLCQRPHFCHLNNMGKNKQLRKFFSPAPYCSEKFEKIHGDVCSHEKSPWIFSDFLKQFWGSFFKTFGNTLFPMYFKWGILRNFTLSSFIFYHL